MKRFIPLIFILFLILPDFSQAAIVLQDNFEYVATRTDVGADAFVDSGPWDGAMCINRTGGSSGSRGYLYTVDQSTFNTVTGASNTFPGQSSSYVAVIEALPFTLGFQTNVYLTIGSETASQSTLPANCWIQYWMYINYYTGQLSRFSSDGTKWLYPCITGTPTCSPSDMAWLQMLMSRSYNPYEESVESNGQAYHTMEAFGGGGYTEGPNDPWKLGINQGSGVGRIPVNTWILVKTHVDITGSSPLVPANQGVYEQWHKTVSGSFVKVIEWLGGVTANYTWPVNNLLSEHTTGQKSLKIGTTFNDYDAWIYLDDFIIATAEADLPTYGGASPPSTPSGITVIYD